MPLQWTPEMDRALLSLVDRQPDATWDDQAAELSATLRVPITKDMARNRFARIEEANRLSRLTPAPPVVEVPGQDIGQFVGLTMAFFDIETTGLNAYGNEMTVAAVTDNFGRTEVRDKFEFEQRSILDDRGLAVWLRDELEKYDILVGWYGTQFDLPFLNAKLVEHGERILADRLFLDPCYKFRGGRYGLKPGSSKLKNVGKWLNTPNQKPDVEWETFRLGGYGDPEALAILRDRCVSDTLVMRDIFAHIKPLVRTLHR